LRRNTYPYRGSHVSILQQTMHRLLIQPSYSIEDIHLAPIDQNQNDFVVKWQRLGTPRFLMKMPVQETCFMSTVPVSQNGLGLKNAIDADVERHALLYRSVKCGVLILAERKRPGVPSLQIHHGLSGPRRMMHWRSRWSHAFAI
jgi:hypothetical protein